MLASDLRGDALVGHDTRTRVKRLARLDGDAIRDHSIDEH
jgi:hypothetical protein